MLHVNVKSVAGAYLQNLSRLTGSMWGVPLLQSRQIYTKMLKLMLTCAAPVWFPFNSAVQRTTAVKRLTKVQATCLRLVCGAYKWTSTPLVERICHIPPIDIYHTCCAATYQSCLSSGIANPPISKSAKRAWPARPVRGHDQDALIAQYRQHTDLIDHWWKAWLSQDSQRRRARKPNSISQQRRATLHGQTGYYGSAL